MPSSSQVKYILYLQRKKINTNSEVFVFQVGHKNGILAYLPHVGPNSVGLKRNQKLNKKKN